jgi:CRP/FNR family cyclic AMP-dependent transcriptional regulator
MRKALYLMGILDDSDTEWLTDNGTRILVKYKTGLIYEGKPISSLYIVLDGQFAVYAGRQLLATLNAGEVLGEISFVDSRPPLATVIALKDSYVLELPREKLLAKMGRDQKFAANFYRGIATYLADRLRVTTGRLGYGKADQDVEEVDEINDDLMDTLSLAAVRFDKMLKRLGGG